MNARLAAAGQGHVLAGWNRLDGAQQRALQTEVAALDLDLVQHLSGLLSAEADPGSASGGAEAAPRFAAPDVFPLERDGDQQRQAVTASAHGAQLLSEGTRRVRARGRRPGIQIGLRRPQGLLSPSAP